MREKISEMEEKILPFILEVPDPILKGKFVSKIADGFDIKEDFVLEALDKVKVEVEEGKKKEAKIAKIEAQKFDISSKNGIIQNTRKKILRELSAIYFWQKSLPDAEQWEKPETILEKIKKFTDEETFEKILNLKKRIVDELILEVQVKFEESTKENFQFTLKSYEDRLEKNLLDEKISLLMKKINLADSDEKKKILTEIQNLTKLKNKK